MASSVRPRALRAAQQVAVHLVAELRLVLGQPLGLTGPRSPAFPGLPVLQEGVLPVQPHGLQDPLGRTVGEAMQEDGLPIVAQRDVEAGRAVLVGGAEGHVAAVPLPAGVFKVADERLEGVRHVVLRPA
jgi:hypothetical protein